MPLDRLKNLWSLALAKALTAGAELDLGKPLAVDFARQFLPGDFDDVRQIFNRRGAYARFKNLLDRRGMLDQWYAFEAEAEESALKMWCELNSIEVSD